MPYSKYYDHTHIMISILPNNTELLLNESRLDRSAFMIPISNIGISMSYIEAINVENGGKIHEFAI